MKEIINKLITKCNLTWFLNLYIIVLLWSDFYNENLLNGYKFLILRLNEFVIFYKLIRSALQVLIRFAFCKLVKN